MINIGIGIGWVKAIYSVANNVIANFKARVLSYPGSIFEAGPCLDTTLEELNAIGLLDNASLVITPNAYNEGILYDVVPNTTLGDMNVVRATTATRVNEQGLVEVVPKNLFTYSNDFSNVAWLKNSITITSNQSDSPSSFELSNLFVPNATVGNRYLARNIDNSTKLFSIYLKKKELSFVKLGTANAAVVVDLENGTLSKNTDIYNDYSILNVQNGWYRVNVYNKVSLAQIQIFGGINSIGTNIATNGTDGFYIYGAQLEQGSTATEYFPTTTRLNIPRIDYTNGGCPSILVEPQRTNLALRSEEFDNTSIWPGSLGVTRLANQAISPDGTNTMDLITFPISGNSISQSVTVISGATYTFSVWLATQSGTQTAEIGNINAGIYQIVNVTTTPTRFQVTQVASATNRFPSIRATAAYSILVWGAQVEAGTYATSYIPTVASAVTRNADVISKTGISGLINSTEGTIFLNSAALSNNTSARFIEVRGNTVSLINNIFIRYEGFLNKIAYSVYSNSTLQCNISFNLNSQSEYNKMAFVWALNRFEIWVNGSKVAEDTLGIPPAENSMNIINFSDRNGNNKFEGNIKSFQLYKTALTDAELIALTTI